MLEQYVLLVCSFFWGLQTTTPSKDQVSSCEDIVIASLNTGEDPALMLSIAWNESAFKTTETSKAGAVGPLQVLPRYWCPKGRKKGCDLVAAGFKAWTTYFEMEEGDELQALCRYNSGKKCGKSPRAKRYAKRVLKTRDTLVKSLYSSWYDRYVQDQCARCPDCCVKVTQAGFVDEYGVERPHDWLPD